MKQLDRLVSSIIVLLAVSMAAGAQNTIATGYFNDGYIYNHKLNPALRPNMDYFTIPFLQINAGTQSNLSAGKLLYKLPNGSIGSFLHPDVPASAVLGQIAPNNAINANLGISLLSFGWYNEKGNIFTTIDFDSNTKACSNLPYDLFAFAKGAYNNGENSGIYHLGGLSAKFYSSGDITFGQSYAIGDERKIKIGYKLKLRFGVIGAEANMEQFDISPSGQKWEVYTKGNMYTEQLYLGTKTKADGKKIYDYTQIRRESFDVMLGNFIRNVGFGIDLGLNYDINDWIQVSACVQDLGMTQYINTHAGVTDNHIVCPESGQSGSASTQINDFLNTLADMAQFEPVEGVQTDRFMSPWTLRAGAQVRLPMYSKLSLGALYSQQFFKNYGWWEVRGSLNYDVLRWLALSVSYGGGTYGGQFGAMLNIHSNGIALHIGTDNIPLKYSKQGIPLDTGAIMASVGLAIQFGTYHGRYPKKDKEQ